MRLRKIVICGSVDDGKSTLLGRLMYELGNYTSNKLEEVQKISKRAGKMELDYSLFTDGLIAEREQGITIDVAHLYMSYNNVRIIWADAPGHEQYTRNMVTAAAGCEAALLLTDISREITPQSLRHLEVLKMLKIPNVLVVVNKMDVINYDEFLYQKRVKKIQEHIGEANLDRFKFIPVSSVAGSNLVSNDTENYNTDHSTVLKWISELKHTEHSNNLYAQIQSAIHAGDDERYFQTWIYNGQLAKGQTIWMPLHDRNAVITKIMRFGNEVDSANSGQAVDIQVDKDLDMPRGTEIFASNAYTENSKTFDLLLFNLDNVRSIKTGRTYILKRGVMETKVKILSVEGNGAIEPNQSAIAKVMAAKEIHKVENISTEGNSTILIDDTSNETCALGVLADFH